MGHWATSLEVILEGQEWDLCLKSLRRTSYLSSIETIAANGLVLEENHVSVYCVCWARFVLAQVIIAVQEWVF